MRSLITSLLLLLCTAQASAFELYKTFQTPEAFLAEAFGAQVPPASMLILNGDMQSQIRQVFGRAYPQARLRYWKSADRTAWIFDDVGKEGYVPTTCGFVVSNGRIETARVLVYRESRGEQVAEPAFLHQLEGAAASGNRLDRGVDAISGATLSVEMMQRMARTALTFDQLSSR